MNRERVIDAFNRWQDANEELFRAFMDLPTASSLTESTTSAPRTASTPSPNRAKAEPAPRSSAAPVVPTRPKAPSPRPTVPAPVQTGKGRNELTDATRAENLPAATDIAKRVMELMDGLPLPQLLDAVQSQLAIQRIPFDRTLVTQAVEAAKHA